MGRGGLDRELKRLSDDGALLFAAAGNNGKNVDTVKCTRVLNRCRERNLTMPCELGHVICVGGLERGSRSRDPGSNSGDSDVDIWAPYDVWVGSDVECICAAQRAYGTSFSSPFTAGVAALVWSANPSLTKDQVWDTMKRTATPVNSGNVTKIVHAGRAVSQAIPTMVRIQAPTAGQKFASGATIPARMTVFPGTKGAPTQTSWMIGTRVVGSGTSASLRLADGTWPIRAVAKFADGSTVESTVTVTVGTAVGPIG
jgi:subtilisin family serine protease